MTAEEYYLKIHRDNYAAMETAREEAKEEGYREGYEEAQREFETEILHRVLELDILTDEQIVEALSLEISVVEKARKEGQK